MNYMEKLRKIIRETKEIADKKEKVAMFSIASTANVNNKEIEFPAIRETENTVCGNILVRSKKHLHEIIKEVDGLVEIILIDAETKIKSVRNLEGEANKLVEKSELLTFRPNDLTVNSADVLINQIKGTLKDKKIAIIGAGNIGSKLALKLVERNAAVYLTRRDKKKLKRIVQGLNTIKSEYVENKIHGAKSNFEASVDADVIIGTTPGTAAITEKMVKNMKANGLILDIGNGTIFPGAVEDAKKRGIKILCLLMKPGYNGEIKTILNTKDVIKKQKNRDLGEFSIISGGVFGKKGDVIVDDVDNPRQILSIADGKGNIIPYNEQIKFQKNIDKVKKIME